VKPRILIAGAGETGSYLAHRLCENWEVVVVDPDAAALESRHLFGCHALHQGDATSALVLRKAGAEEAHAVVACTGKDEVNLEVMRLARDELRVDNLYSVMESFALEKTYARARVDAVDRSQACAVLLESRIEGRKVATSIGLGEGEIQEVEVLANSSVIGQRLADLRPRRWLVGAVYREGELIVPHGDTVIQEGDRVVIVGEPDILSAMATHIGQGESEFPLHYGCNLVLADVRLMTGAVDEIKYLFENTEARALRTVFGKGAVVTAVRVEDGGVPLVKPFDEAGIPSKQLEVSADSPAQLAAQLEASDMGMLLLWPQDLPWLCRVGLRRSWTVKLLDHLRSPVLICRGTFPYARVLLVLAEPDLPSSTTQLAIDLCRKVGGRLHLGVVHQPELVVGAQLREEMEEKRRQVENLASMYHVDVELLVMEGNPIEQVVARSEDFDALVLPYKRGRTSSLTRPDVAQNLMHRAACSTLVMPF